MPNKEAPEANWQPKPPAVVERYTAEDLFETDTIAWVKKSMTKQYELFKARYPDEEFSGAWAHVRADEFVEMVQTDLTDNLKSLGVDISGSGDYFQSEWVSQMNGIFSVAAVIYLQGKGELTPHGRACAGFVGWFMQGGWREADEEISKRMFFADGTRPFYGKMLPFEQAAFERLPPEEQEAINQRVAQFMQRLLFILDMPEGKAKEAAFNKLASKLGARGAGLEAQDEK